MHDQQSGRIAKKCIPEHFSSSGFYLFSRHFSLLFHNLDFKSIQETRLIIETDRKKCISEHFFSADIKNKFGLEKHLGSSIDNRDRQKKVHLGTLFQQRILSVFRIFSLIFQNLESKSIQGARLIIETDRKSASRNTFSVADIIYF